MSTHEKACTRCGEVKSLDGFYRDKKTKDGRRTECKECTIEHIRRYREENRDEQREYQRRYRKENRNKILESKRRYYEENRDKELERHRRYREENLDERREHDRRYYEENRDILNQGTKIRHTQYTRTSNLLASKKGDPYSTEEDALLLTNDGRSNYQKAIELGRTHDSVRGRLRRLRQAQAQ